MSARVRHRRGHDRRDTLTDAQRAYLSSGAGQAATAFDSETAARLAWADHRETMVEVVARIRPGRRPFGFWRYDARDPDLLSDSPAGPLYEHLAADGAADLHARQVAYLAAHGLLSPAEREAIAHPTPRPDGTVSEFDTAGQAALRMETR